jgi:hypothetical protein
MEVDVMLCDHAEAQGGKLFMNGGGIAYAFVQPSPPHVISLALALVIQVPYTATNQPHSLTVRMFDADGNPVVPWVPAGAAAPGAVVCQAPFNVGRPPQIVPGDTQPYPVTVNLMSVPLQSQGAYSFSIEIDGTEMRRLTFRVVVPAPGTYPMALPAG